MANRTYVTDNHFEGTTPLLEFDILSELGVGFKPTELRLTLSDAKSGTVINSRSNQSVIDSCDNSGHVAIWLEPADLELVDPVANRSEVRRALFRWTWAAGARVGSHVIEFPVENYEHLPPV